jgi:hypothetical protein
MSRAAALSSWVTTVSTNMTNLSTSQAFVLAAWSFAMVIAQSAGTTSCAVLLAALWLQPENTVRQRLREFCYEKKQKRGEQRHEIEVKACFAPLLRWLLSHWPATHPYLALALDVTTLGDRFSVLCCSLVYRGTAIPIAWKVLPGNKKGAWRPHWLAMLEQLNRELNTVKPASIVPAGWTVIVLTDRGLYAAWLFKAIVAKGWHPYMRLQRQGNYQLLGQDRWRDIKSVVTEAGMAWSGEVVCFKGESVHGTLMGRWEEGQKEPWLVLTDLAPAECDCVWYGLRMWIEHGFKDLKRGGFHWEQTKMAQAERIERHWLVMAVATLWVVSVGGAAEEAAVSGLEELEAGGGVRQVRKGSGRVRLVSVFRRGVLLIIAAAVRGEAMAVGEFWPQPWPNEAERGKLRLTVLRDEPDDEHLLRAVA